MEVGEMVVILQKGDEKKRAIGRLHYKEDGTVDIKIEESTISILPPGVARFEEGEDREGRKDFFHLRPVPGTNDYSYEPSPTYLIGNKEERGEEETVSSSQASLF